MIKKTLIVLLLTFTALAQKIETKDGVVEFVGLKKWNINDLVDSLIALDPNSNLHACAFTLKQHFKFADASCIIS